MMTTKLTICALPDKSMTFMNSVLLHDDTEEYLVVSKHYVRARKEPTIKLGEIGMSALLRTFLNVNIGDVVTVESAIINPDTAVHVTLGVELVTKRQIEVKEADFIASVKNTLKAPLYPKLQLAYSYFGDTYKITVQTTTGVIPVIIDSNTTVEIKLTPHPYLKWVVSKPRIKPIFNFEQLGIGGLDAQFSDIFRRVFTSRMCPPEEAQELGLKHVKGIVLYGAAGTGKTLIARKIGEILGCRPPKIVNGPEILSKYVGESENNIRALFADAEEDEKENGIHADLHLIIFDEIDAICKTRGTVKNSTGVGDTVVNQLLTKLDGVNQLNNILVVAMTNRIDMLDPALLRAGRLEVHIEVPVPNETGRAQIFAIHTKKLKESGKLDADVDCAKLAEMTPGMTGATIEGIVRCAIQTAMYENMNATTTPTTKGITISMKHFEIAICDAMLHY